MLWQMHLCILQGNKQYTRALHQIFHKWDLWRTFISWHFWSTYLKRLELIGGPLWVALLLTQYFWIAPLEGTEIQLFLQFQFLRNGISTAFLRNDTYATFLIIRNWLLRAQNWGGLRFFVPSMRTSEKRVIYD